MTGGWKPYDEDEFRVWPVPLPLQLELSDAQLKVDEMLAWLHRGARFKRAAMRVLREQGLRFTEWRVLRAMQRLHGELRDAVSQQAVAKRAEMDEGSVCEVMHRLHRRGLADIGFDQWGWAQRIVVTTHGEETLRDAEERIALLHGARAEVERESSG